MKHLEKIDILPHVSRMKFDESAIYQRLEQSLRKYRLSSSRRKIEKLSGFDLVDESEFDIDTRYDVLTDCDKRRLKARVAAMKMRADRSSGTSHIKEDGDRERLLSISDYVYAAPAMTERRADEIAAALHASCPWSSSLTEEIWMQLRRCARRGERARISPVLIFGPPGVGKTHIAKRIAGEIGTVSSVIDATAGGTSMTLAGLERGWRGGEPGKLVRTIIETRRGDPLVFIDELDKSSSIRSESGRSFSINETLLGMTERVSARAWTCPFYDVQFDISHVSWIFAANDIRRISAPLLSRSRIIKMRAPSRSELLDFAERRAADAGIGDAAAGAALEAIERSTFITAGFNLRDVQRVIDRAESLESLPVFH